MTRPFKQNDPRADFRKVYFTAVDMNSTPTRLQSSDMSTFVVYLTKNGGTPVDISARTPVQVGATNAKGVFYVPLIAGDLDTPGRIVVVISNTGGTKTMEKRELDFDVEPALFGTAVTGTLGVSSFTTSLTDSNDAHKDKLLRFLTGSLALQVKKVGAFANAGGIVTLATIAGVQQAFTAAPANLDVFELLSA